MDEKKLWMKISGSINHYLRYYDKRMSDEELLEDYVEYVLGGENGSYEYLDKQTFKYVEVSKEIEEKAKSAFIERLNKRRAKEEPIEKVEEKREYKNNTYSRSVCINKCINNFRVRYKRIFFLWFFTYK